MTWLSVCSLLEAADLLACLFIVQLDFALDTSSQELKTVLLVVAGKKLGELVVNLVQLLATCCVPVVQSTISISGNNHILGHTWGLKWAPSDDSGWHWLSHGLIQSVTALSCEHIVDLDSTVTLASSDVLVIPVEAHAEGWRRHITQGVLVGDL